MMQSCVVVVAVLCVLASVAQAEIDKQKALEVLKKCKDATQATEDIKDVLENHSIPTTPEGKCMMNCVMEDRGLMKDGKFDHEGAAKFFERIYKDDEAKLKKAAEVMAACASTDVMGMNKCEKATAYMGCAAQKGLKL